MAIFNLLIYKTFYWKSLQLYTIPKAMNEKLLLPHFTPTIIFKKACFTNSMVENVFSYLLDISIFLLFAYQFSSFVF